MLTLDSNHWLVSDSSKDLEFLLVCIPLNSDFCAKKRARKIPAPAFDVKSSNRQRASSASYWAFRIVASGGTKGGPGDCFALSRHLKATSVAVYAGRVTGATS